MILLLEPNNGDVQLLSTALQERAWTSGIHHIDDGDAAYDHLQALAAGSLPAPSLILVASRMPKRPGVDLLTTIRQSPGLIQIPAFLFSSDTDDHERIAGGILPEQCIAKPCTWDECLAVADQLIALIASSKATIASARGLAASARNLTVSTRQLTAASQTLIQNAKALLDKSDGPKNGRPA